MFCANCGTKLEEGNSFCHNCGTKVEIAPMGAATQPNRDSTYHPMQPTIEAQENESMMQQT